MATIPGETPGRASYPVDDFFGELRAALEREFGRDGRPVLLHIAPAPYDYGHADPAECEHDVGYCLHRDTDDVDESGCYDCGKVWPFPTCGMTNAEIDRLERRLERARQRSARLSELETETRHDR